MTWASITDWFKKKPSASSSLNAEAILDSAWIVADAYAELLETHTFSFATPDKKLPYSKDKIKIALRLMYQANQDNEYRSANVVAYLSLALFQDLSSAELIALKENDQLTSLKIGGDVKDLAARLAAIAPLVSGVIAKVNAEQVILREELNALGIN